MQHFLDFETCCNIIFRLQKSASIQSRTSFSCLGPEEILPVSSISEGLIRSSPHLFKIDPVFTPRHAKKKFRPSVRKRILTSLKLHGITHGSRALPRHRFFPCTACAYQVVVVIATDGMPTTPHSGQSVPSDRSELVCSAYTACAIHQIMRCQRHWPHCSFKTNRAL